MRTSRAIAAAAWTGVGALAFVLLVGAGSTPHDVLAYGAVWALTTTLPGAVVWQACTRGGPRAALAFGPVVGMAGAIACGTAAATFGVPALAWTWPAATLAVVLAVPAWRRRLRPRTRSPRTVAPRLVWHLGTAVACAGVLVVLAMAAFRSAPLPPARSAIYPDRWYHLSLVDALARGLPARDPAALGEPLRYHWFTHAHMATTADLAGADRAAVALHLWIVAAGVTVVVAAAALATRLATRWGASPLGAALAGPVTALVGGILGFGWGNGISPASPTTTTAALALIGLVAAVDAGLGPRRVQWPAVGLAIVVLLLGAGSKPTVLPLALCGGLTLLAGQVVPRWREARAATRVGAVVAVAAVVVALVATPLVAGSTSGSRLQLFATATGSAAFDGLDEPHPLQASGGLVAPLLERPGLAWLGVAVIAAWILLALPAVAGSLAFLGGRLHDPVGRYAAGVVLGGFAVTWVLAHPGMSQVYFWRSVVLLGVAVTCAVSAATWPSTVRRTRRAVLVAATTAVTVGAGVLVVVLTPAVFSGTPGTRATALLVPDGVVTVAVLAVAVGARALGGRGAAVPLVLATIVGLGAITAVPATARTVRSLETPAPAPTGRGLVTEPEQRAARWIAAHTPRDAVVATNVVCLGVRYRPGCSTQSFWVAALTQRQLLIGGWAYTSASMGSDPGTPYATRPSPWPDRLDASLQAITDPTPARLAALRERWGVTYLYADRRATDVSPDLARYGRLRYADGGMWVVEL